MSEQETLILRIDETTAAHLRSAIALWERECRHRLGMRTPPALAELSAALAGGSSGVMRGHLGSAIDNPPPVPEPVPVHRLWATYDEAAAALGCSRSTVKRRVRTGHLAAVKTNGIARIRLTDLERYAANTQESA